MIRRLLILAAITLAACASNPPTGATSDARDRDPAFRYGRNPGPSPVGAIPDVFLNDAARNRDVKMSIDYPTRVGPHPVIVFSHGGGGSNRGYPGLSSHWASYGYVVIRPQHNEPLRPEDMTVTDWRNRTGDIRFVIDSLTTLAERFPELQGKMDANRIGVAGHSRGAMTAMMVGGLRTFPGPVSFHDPRVKAVAALSPTGPREMWGVTTESWAEVRGPMLFMTGTRDTGPAEDETPQWRQQAFELSPAGDKWLITIEGVNANTFTGQLGVVPERPRPTQPVPGPIDPRTDPTGARRDAERIERTRTPTLDLNQRALFGTIRSLALAFFDTYLKDDANARQHLEQADARGNVEVRNK